MYLRSISLVNTGPIQKLNLTMPFDGERPKPLVLVGRNGSGKSTVISFLVNALVGIKQQVYEDIEIEKGKVYRIRSPLGIHGNAGFYHARLNFDNGISLVEWQLNRRKQDFDTPGELAATDTTWDQIPPTETDFYQLTLGSLTQKHLLEEKLQSNGLLFFPADRFEPPDWLNTEDLSNDLKLPEPSRVKGRTDRRIFVRNRLKPTLDWLNSVIFDMKVIDDRLPDGTIRPNIRATIVFSAVQAVLNKVLCHSHLEKLQLQIGDRKSRIISAVITRDGQPVRVIKDLLSLSAGESALFCMFASIIRDADLSSMQFNSLDQITGIVAIDEADLHLHMSLQLDVFPSLIALFPKVQFVISMHSPMLAIGLERVLGIDGFEIREMPTGEAIAPESYSEFLAAFDTFASTRKFQNDVLARVNASVLPVVLVEGKTDATLISAAWSKLYPDDSMPYELVPCGIEPNPDERNGGAKMLRSCLELLPIVSDRKVVAIFDNDRSGNEQFNGLNIKKAFDAGKDDAHRKHKQKEIHAVLLPVPAERIIFVSPSKISNRYLSIEHYFTDDLLLSNGLKGEPVIADSQVFEIDGSSAKKVAFADAAKDFPHTEFGNFVLLFDRLKDIVQ